MDAVVQEASPAALDAPHSGTTTAPRQHHRAHLAELLGLSLILLVYAAALAIYFVPVVDGIDANAYHVSARMLAEHGHSYRVPDDDLQFVGTMWVVDAQGHDYPKYPPVYPAMAALAMKIGGEHAGLLVSLVCGWLAVLGAWLLCRSFLPGWASLLAAFAFATNPVLGSLAIHQHSHAASVALTTWGFALLFWAQRRAVAPRLLLLGSGLALGCAVGVRYPDALLALPPLWWLIAGNGNGPPRRWPHLASWCVGFGIPTLALAAYHQIAFGAPWRTGYSLTDEQHAFSLSSFVHHLHLYAPALVTHGVGPLLALSACGFVVVWQRSWRRGVFYALWLVPLAALYMSYYWAIEGNTVGYMRFFLPLLLPSVVLALVLARDLVALLPGGSKSRAALVAMLFAVQAAWGVPGSLQEMESRYAVHERILSRTDIIRHTAAPGSVVFGTPTLLDALDFDQRYRLYDSLILDRDALASRLQASGALQRGPDAMQIERALALKHRLLDIDADAYHATIAGLIDARLGEGRAVYLAVPESEVEAFEQHFGERYRVEPAAEIPTWKPRHRLIRVPGLETLPPAKVVRVLQR